MLSLSHNWSYVLLRVVYGRILMKILRDTLFEGRTRPVSTLVGCGHAQQSTMVFLRFLKTYAAVWSTILAMGTAHCDCQLVFKQIYVTHTTRASNVCWSYVALSITSTRFLTLRSATGATTGRTRAQARSTFTRHVQPVVSEA